MGWLVFVGYVGGWVFTSRQAAMWLARDLESFGDLDQFEQVGTRALGVMIGTLWPLVVIGALVTGKLPKTPRQLQGEIEERDRRIRELERELGVDR